MRAVPSPSETTNQSTNQTPLVGLFEVLLSVPVEPPVGAAADSCEPEQRGERGGLQERLRPPHDAAAEGPEVSTASFLCIGPFLAVE